MKIHLDTDLGGDIDDLCALAMLLNWPGVELVGVTTVAEHQGKRAGYTQYALALAGRDQVPVAAGADVSLECYRSFPGLPAEERYWPEPILPKSSPMKHALDLLEKSIQEGAIIAAVGPYTNLALLEKRAPGILSQANLFLMGGYVFPVRSGFPAWDGKVDFNVQVDVESANFVFESSNPTLVPLSVTVETALRRAYLARLLQSGPLARLIARQAAAFAEDLKYEALFGQTCEGLPADTINFQHDPLACAIALGWDQGVTIEKVPVSSTIVDGWMQQKTVPGGKMTSVVCAVDGPAFSEFWVKLVTSQAGKEQGARSKELESRS